MGIYSQLNAPSTGGFSPVQMQIASNSSALNFTTGISSAFNIYYLEFYGATVSVNAASLDLQISTNGGSSYISTGYTQSGQYNTAGSLGAFNLAVEAGNCLLFTQDNTGTIPGCGTCRMYNFNSTTFNKQFWTVFSGAAGGANISGTSITNSTTTAVVNAIRIVPTSGTFSGVFALYGIVGS